MYPVRYLSDHEKLCRTKLLSNFNDYYVKNVDKMKPKCEKCNKNFGNEDRLNAHRQKCNGDNKQCPICNKVIKRHLQRHIDLKYKVQMSSGNGYFMVKEKVKTNKVKGMKNCWQCNKLFSRKSTLKRHIQMFHSNGEDCNFEKNR